MDPRAHGHPRAALRRGGRGDLGPRRCGVEDRARRRGNRTRAARPDRLRDAHSRHADPIGWRVGAAKAEHRHAGVRRERRVRGIFVCAVRGGCVHRVGTGRDGARDRRRGTFASHEFRRPRHVDPVRRRRGGRRPPSLGVAGCDRLGARRGRTFGRDPPHPRRRFGEARVARDRRRERTRDLDAERPRGLQACGGRDVERVPSAPGEVRIHRGGRGRPDPAPGELADHDRGGRAPRRSDGSSGRRRRRDRKHVGCLDPHRARPRLAGRPCRGGRPGSTHVVRRGARLGREPDPLDRTGGIVTSKVAVVTGGSRGIGRACAEALAGAGWSVAIGYRTREADAKEALDSLEAAGTPGMTVYLDVADEASVQEAFRRVSDEAGPVTGLVNNAGYSRDGLLLKYSMEEYERTMSTNLRGSFLCSRAALRSMLREKWGRIVNMSSAVAIHGNAGQTVYAATKAGLLGLTKSLAREVAAKGITVNALCPGLLETEMTSHLTEEARSFYIDQTPSRRPATLHEVSALVRFLMSEEASYMNGTVIPVDGGLTA